jgi:hypothetical protein
LIRNAVGGAFYTVEAYNRFFYYPATGSPPAHYTPTLWADGVDEVTAAGTVQQYWTWYKNLITSRLPVSSPLQMSMVVEYGAKIDTGTVHVEVVATDPITLSNLKLRLAIIESDLSSGGKTYNQMLRDYFPTTSGVSLTIAEGDTFSHSEDFVIKDHYKVQNCGIVTFVQSDATREVLQSIQGPVIVPVPGAVSDLKVTLSKADLVLQWPPVMVDTSGNPLEVDLYHIYRDTAYDFTPGAPFDTTTDTVYVDNSGVVGDTGTNYYYIVSAVAGAKESSPSAAAGEYDFYLSNVE